MTNSDITRVAEIECGVENKEFAQCLCRLKDEEFVHTINALVVTLEECAQYEEERRGIRWFATKLKENIRDKAE